MNDKEILKTLNEYMDVDYYTDYEVTHETPNTFCDGIYQYERNTAFFDREDAIKEGRRLTSAADVDAHDIDTAFVVILDEEQEVLAYASAEECYINTFLAHYELKEAAEDEDAVERAFVTLAEKLIAQGSVSDYTLDQSRHSEATYLYLIRDDADTIKIRYAHHGVCNFRSTSNFYVSSVAEIEGFNLELLEA